MRVGQLKQLTGVILDDCSKITDAGLAHLTKLQNLNQLSLRTYNRSPKQSLWMKPLG